MVYVMDVPKIVIRFALRSKSWNIAPNVTKSGPKAGNSNQFILQS